MEHINSDPLDSQHKVILVVEDDEAVGDFMLTARKLEDAYRAVLATNASEALALVNTIRSDLCVLDCHLPGITGLELAEHLRQMDLFQQLPIILLSSDAPRHVKEREDLTFLEKPFSLDELLVTVSRLLGS